MSSKPVHKFRPPPVYDYSSAIAKAVEWLGDRYLLAKSINATPQYRGSSLGFKTLSGYQSEDTT